MDRPTLIQGAWGTRGRYRTVTVIPAEDTPLLTNGWIFSEYQRVFSLGYDRCRIKVWIEWRGGYLTI